MTEQANEEQGIRTDGRAKLVAWMAESPARTQGFVARMLGVTQPAVRNWVRGECRPELPFREALEALCGIPVADWELEEERERREEALKRIREGADTPVAPTGTEGD